MASSYSFLHSSYSFCLLSHSLRIKVSEMTGYERDRRGTHFCLSWYFFQASSMYFLHLSSSYLSPLFFASSHFYKHVSNGILDN